MLKKTILAMLVASTFLISNVNAAMDQAGAKLLADDYANIISAATGVVGSLQSDINASTVKPEQISIDAIQNSFKEKYKAKAGKDYDTSAAGIVGEMRSHVLVGMETIIDEYKKDILAGGQDAFVPAYFRALVVEQVNAKMGDIMESHVTNREADLINTDSAVEYVTEGSPLASEFIRLVNAGTTDAVDKVVKNRYMSYRPLKLKGSCVACHIRNGMTHQATGEFGGALIMDITLK